MSALAVCEPACHFVSFHVSLLAKSDSYIKLLSFIGLLFFSGHEMSTW